MCFKSKLLQSGLQVQLLHPFLLILQHKKQGTSEDPYTQSRLRIRSTDVHRPELLGGDLFRGYTETLTTSTLFRTLKEPNRDPKDYPKP